MPRLNHYLNIDLSQGGVMGEKTNEQLSALIDDELTEFERRRLFSGLLEDDSNRTTLARYQLVGEVLRQKEAGPLLRPAFSWRISEAIADEHDRVEADKPIAVAWRRPLAGMAVAASVAMMSIWLAPKLFEAGGGPAGEPVIAAKSQPQPVIQSRPVPQPAGGEGTYWQTLPPELENKLNRYLVNHAEFAAGKGMDRMLPYASFVSYDRKH